jgi:hypothetical protein
MSNLSVAADLVNVYPQLRIGNNIEVDSRILSVPLRNVTEGRANQHPSEFKRSAKRKIVTVSTFIFPHFSPKTLTNINILTTRPLDNVYLRCKNK